MTTADRSANPETHAGPETTPDPPAWKSPVALGVVLGTTALGLFIDLWSKYAAFAQVAGAPVTLERADVLAADRLSDLIPSHEPVTVVPGLLDFTLVLNPGAVFGAGAGKRWLFVTFTLVAVVFASWMFARWTSARDRWAHVGIGLLVSGGLGNLYDRLVYACVRDFIHPLPGVGLPFGIRWPNGSPDVWPYVSNVADLFLIIGIGILLVISWSKPVSADDTDQSNGRGADAEAGASGNG
jgi:signal peptidase II